MGLKSQIISIHNLTYLFESRLIQVGQILTIHTKIKVSNWLSFCFFTVSTLWIGLLPPGSETTAQCIPVISRRTNCITLTISIHLQNVYSAATQNHYYLVSLIHVQLNNERTTRMFHAMFKRKPQIKATEPCYDTYCNTWLQITHFIVLLLTAPHKSKPKTLTCTWIV